MYDLPTTITLRDEVYAITNKGDFRMVLDCFSALEDLELSEDLRVLASLLIFYEDFNDVEDIPHDEDLLLELVKEMFRFFNCGQYEEETKTSNSKLIDWSKDAQMIMSAINNVAGKEVRAEEYVHWWTFIGYYMSIGESMLATVVSIRNKILKGEKLEKWEQKFRTENAKYFEWNSKSIEEQELDELVHELWNNGR